MARGEEGLIDSEVHSVRGATVRPFTGAGIHADPAGGGRLPTIQRLRLDKRLERLELRLTEQEALLERLRELLRMPHRRTALTSPPPSSLPIWRRTALGVVYASGVFARLLVAGTATLLALGVVAATLRLISK